MTTMIAGTLRVEAMLVVVSAGTGSSTATSLAGAGTGAPNSISSLPGAGGEAGSSSTTGEVVRGDEVGGDALGDDGAGAFGDDVGAFGNDDGVGADLGDADGASSARATPTMATMSRAAMKITWRAIVCWWWRFCVCELLPMGGQCVM